MLNFKKAKVAQAPTELPVDVARKAIATQIEQAANIVMDLEAQIEEDVALIASLRKTIDEKTEKLQKAVADHGALVKANDVLTA